MKNKKLASLVTGAFCFWVALSNLLIVYLGSHLPVMVVNILSIAYFIFIPLNPIFSLLGLLEGEMIRGPNPLGVGLGCLFYAGILYGLVRLIGKKKGPPNK